MLKIFTKRNIIYHTKILLFFLTFHFVLITFIRFQIGKDLNVLFLNNPIFNLWKEFYLLFIYFIIIGYVIKYRLFYKIKKNKLFYFTFFLLIFCSSILAFLTQKSLKFFVIGFKYDLWFLFPAVMYSFVEFDKKEKKELLLYFIKLIKLTIIFSLIFALIRYLVPKFLFLLGYGPLGDWRPNISPPMYFETGVYGIKRLSGIFSGPNHMAFYFVGFGPLILLLIFYRKLHYIWGLLYLFLLLGSLSRSGIIAFILEVFILCFLLAYLNKNYRKKILVFLLLIILLIIVSMIYLFISGKYNQVVLRSASTIGHINRFITTLELIKEKPLLGYGLGTAGPSAHYLKTHIIPESWILQIFYELGFIVGTWWFFYLFLVIYNLKKTIKITYPLSLNTIFSLGISVGLIGLLFQGLVLHSFEDSMITLPLFILIGILLAEEHKL